MHRIRAFDFSSYSDGELRVGLMRLRYRAQHLELDEFLSHVFAIVAEVINRRIGVWRLFDESFNRRKLEKYWEIGTRIAGSSTPHWENSERDQLDINWDQWLSAHPEIGHWDSDERVIAGTVARVLNEIKVRLPWDVLLPGEFYQAALRKDEQGVLAFQPTDEQLLAGLNLFQGHIVQMNSGEGKTIAAAFPAVAHALLGNTVHVITANDYLAGRDANLLAPVYESLGISAGAVLGYMEDGERRFNYEKGIVHGTMRELGFDYLRDNLKVTAGAQVQGKLEVAIIDEVDHALIDEAFTPMIISGSPLGNRSAVTKVKKAVRQLMSLQGKVAQGLAGQLSLASLGSREERRVLAQLLLAEPENPAFQGHIENHPGEFKRIKVMADLDQPGLTLGLLYAIDPDSRFVTLTELGRDILVESLGPFYDGRSLEESLDGVWERQDLPLAERRKKAAGITRRLARQYNLGNQVYQMLRAHLLMKRDVDYLVTEDCLVLIDKATGRPKTDCVYQHGLQSALEAKEGITIRPENETLGQVSVEGFIKQYRHISGMTGTASGSADEFHQRYGLRVAELPPTRPLLRVDLGYRVYLNGSEKTLAIIDEIISCHRVGQPVLVGTLTVEHSQELSRLLSEHGVAHNLLNAVNSEAEAQTIREAGAFGAVTVATNMAGRGTDILLEPGLNEKITQQYHRVVQQLVSGGVGPVAIRCHSPQEAQILCAELANSPVLSAVRDEDSNRQQVTVNLKPGKGNCGRLKPTNNIDNCHFEERSNEGSRRDPEILRGVYPEPSRRAQNDIMGGLLEPHSPEHSLDFSLGLRVIGTGINDTPRIDLQLNGRSGRQGDFGVTQTFLSLEDRLLNLHVEGVLKMQKCRRVDASGRNYFAGKAVDGHIEHVQRMTEHDAEVQRSLIQDYATVLDRQTGLFYNRRRKAIDSMDSDQAWKQTCIGFARELAVRLVAGYFPQVTLESYAAQFERMADEIQLDYQVDCSLLRGCDLTLLPEELVCLFISKLEGREEEVGPKEFSALACQIYLDTCDDLWKSHMTGLQDSISNQLLSHAGHNSAVSHYVRRSFDAWSEFLERVNGEFLSRLVTFPIDQIEPRESAAVRVDEEVRMLIADRPMAMAVANSQ